MRCLIVDNYDSFTWNLADYVSQIFDEPPIVVRNDEFTWEELRRLHRFEAIIVSPGPGTVTNDDDLNMSRDALAQDEIPVLGVCLGFQGLAHVYGGVIQHAPEPFHGRVSRMRHHGDELFANMPAEFAAVRYHSLIVDIASLPECLVPVAHSECGLLMALRHASLPKWGIQFHPESILTEHGKTMIANFRDLAARHHRMVSVMPSDVPSDDAGMVARIVASRALDLDVGADAVFSHLFANEPNAFWLDSQRVTGEMSRYSFMGCVDEGDVLRHAGDEPDGDAHLLELEHGLDAVPVVGGDPLPFEFRGGYVGFMTYEAKAIFGAKISHGSPMPDSVWMRVERFVAFDHATHRIHLVALHARGGLAEADEWLDQAARRLLTAVPLPPVKGLENDRMTVRLAQGRDEYLASIERCKHHIVDGESYEVCLTNAFSFEARVDPFELYRVMRRDNAAPFGAYLRVGGQAVLSTSPERFIRVDADGSVQAKPIKGTCARHDDPGRDAAAALQLASSEKDRAENLMIVDLMRNDLARVSTPGSVSVPKLMDIESYQTVHQMVSTVESALRPECSLVDLLKAIYPGGSITGAPKIRTMEIIDGLEPCERGVYCGSIGYLGYGKVADLNIAIRTLSYDGRTARFGAGGAITYLSDPAAEFDEVLLKAEALLRPIWRYMSASGSRFEYRLEGNDMVLRDESAVEQEV